MTTCYVCGAPSCSREHVPPKNLFPERKDFYGLDLRRDLITVPSCKLHNSAKSHDDEFLMVSLAGIIGNNSIGYRHKFTKVNRAIVRSANRLLDEAFLGERDHYKLVISKNKFIEVIWGKPDHKRLIKCFDYISRGLYYHHFQERFVGNTKTLIAFTSMSDRSSANFLRFIKDKSAIELAEKERHGANPDVFHYQISDADPYGLIHFRLCFYGGVEAYTVLKPDGTNFEDTLLHLILKAGIKTKITLGDKEYEIN